jgi:hypothetical protein
MQRYSSAIANFGAAKGRVAPEIFRPPEREHRFQGGSLDGVQLENRPRLSHKDALNQERLWSVVMVAGQRRRR